MFKKIIALFFIILSFSLLTAQSKKGGLKKSLTEYFSKLKRRYLYTRTWKSKLLVYRKFFPEFAALLKSNAARTKNIGSYYFLGMASGYLDLTAHISLLEGKLYEGEWGKAYGALLKVYFNEAYSVIYYLLISAKMKYYQLYKPRRQVFTQKLFIKLARILAQKARKNKKLKRASRIFLAGYLNPFMVYISLNYFLDNKLKLNQFVNILLKTLKPGKKKKK